MPDDNLPRLMFEQTAAGADAFREFLKEVVTRIFNTTGEVRPDRVYMIARRDHDTCAKLEKPVLMAVLLDGGFMATPDSKDTLATMLRVMAIRTDAIAHAMIQEMWVRDYVELSEIDQHRSLSTDPKSREKLVIGYQHVGLVQRSRMLSADIIRPEDVAPSLGEWADMELDAKHSRFGSIISPTRDVDDKITHTLNKLKELRSQIPEGKHEEHLRNIVMMWAGPTMPTVLKEAYADRYIAIMKEQGVI